MDEAPGLSLVLDCRDPEALAPFWSAALGYVNVGSVDNYTVLAPDGRPGPMVMLQRVPEGKSVKNRMHLDLHPADVEATVAELEALGGRRLQPDDLREHGHHWVLMADPEGNEFCVCGADNC